MSKLLLTNIVKGVDSSDLRINFRNSNEMFESTANTTKDQYSANTTEVTHVMGGMKNYIFFIEYILNNLNSSILVLIFTWNMFISGDLEDFFINQHYFPRPRSRGDI